MKNIQVSQRNIWLATALFIALIASLLLVYYFRVILPLQANLTIIEHELATEKQIVQSLEQQINEQELTANHDSLQLQRQLPVEPLADQFVLALEKAEIISESFISAMDFQVGEMTATELTADNNEATGEQTESEQQDDTVTERQDSDTVTAFPEGMERLTVNLSVVSPTYESLVAFLTALESLERITKIDSIAFSGGQELTTLADRQESIAYSVTISTFYLPILAELRDGLPKLQLPEPSNKTNPLPQGHLSSAVIKTARQTAALTREAGQPLVLHRVQEGET